MRASLRSATAWAGLALALLLSGSVTPRPEMPVSPTAGPPPASHAPALPLPEGDVVRGALGGELDAFLSEQGRRGLSGAVLVAADGVVLLKKGYGLADREAGVAVSSETLFAVGTLAKMFTAAAVLKLEAQRRLSVDDHIGEHLGAFPGRKAEATIHQLLVHTAGLVGDGSLLDYSGADAFVSSVKDAPPDFVPGAEFEYSSAGYTLLAAIVEKVSGTSFESFLAREVFAPAGMTSTRFAWEVGTGDDVATGYEGPSVRDLTPVPPALDVWGTRGPSGVVTTVGDLFRWTRALQTDAVLPAAERRKMFTRYVGNEGYGWHIIPDSTDGDLVRRGGSLPAFEASLRWYRDTDVVIAFLLNNNLGFRISVAKGVARILGQLPADFGS